jgi:metal-responsive CopG/Arc/MetJ family transcriptional regulator
MRNVQVTVDDDTLRQVDRAAKPLGLKRSEIVRQALRMWLRSQAVDRFEQQWIAALEARPDEAVRADEWLHAQGWARR